MPLFEDQIGNKLQVISPPRKIISLVPSQSEFLWDIGLRSEIVGVTKFCVHPAELRSKSVNVGGTKKLNLSAIRKLGPDLIIGNKEENSEEDINRLREVFPVWMSDIVTLGDAYRMMQSLGSITNREKATEEFLKTIKESLESARNCFSGIRVAYFIWKDPYMLAAGATFIDHILTFMGITNVAEGMRRYPEVDVQTLKSLRPEYCFLSSEPYPFKETHCYKLQDELPEAKIVLVDGEMFSWYGSRLRLLGGYAEKLKGSL